MNTEQPEALRREYRATMPHEIMHLWAVDALACIASLEAQLEAIGAGGISPLIAGAGFDAADMATAAAQGFRDGATAPAQPVAAPATQQGVAYAEMPTSSPPSLITTTATLTPHQMNGFIDKMDRLGLVYLFTLNNTEQTSSGVEQHLVCMVDGADIAGFTIVLHSDGTWKALADVIVGEGVPT